MPDITTREQGMAQRAFERAKSADSDDYRRFAKSFPALIRTAGLCQATAFADARGVAHRMVLADVVHVTGLGLAGEGTAATKFANHCRSAELPDYMRATRLALQGATWLKRYVEALEKDREVVATSAIAAGAASSKEESGQ